jgi:hypothetical protein
MDIYVDKIFLKMSNFGWRGLSEYFPDRADLFRYWLQWTDNSTKLLDVQPNPLVPGRLGPTGTSLPGTVGYCRS